MCAVAEVRSDEVCQMATFHAECPQDQVIVMESAHLGRLKIGQYILGAFLTHNRSNSDVLDDLKLINSFRCEEKENVAYKQMCGCCNTDVTQQCS